MVGTFLIIAGIALIIFILYLWFGVLYPFLDKYSGINNYLVTFLIATFFPVPFGGILLLLLIGVFKNMQQKKDGTKKQSALEEGLVTT